MIRDIDEEEKYEIDTSAVVSLRNLSFLVVILIYLTYSPLVHHSYSMFQDTVAGFLCNGFISAALRKIAIMFTTKM